MQVAIYLCSKTNWQSVSNVHNEVDFGADTNWNDVKHMLAELDKMNWVRSDKVLGDNIGYQITAEGRQAVESARQMRDTPLGRLEIFKAFDQQTIADERKSSIL
ncbi:MAG: hypothetical protein ACREBU_20940 [Nitrososphaera sp.]